MKLTAHELAVIIDTLNHSLMISNWSGYYTAKSRENVRDLIGAIMDEMSVEVITTKAEYSIDADMGV